MLNFLTPRGGKYAQLEVYASHIFMLENKKRAPRSNSSSKEQAGSGEQSASVSAAARGAGDVSDAGPACKVAAGDAETKRGEASQRPGSQINQDDAAVTARKGRDAASKPAGRGEAFCPPAFCLLNQPQEPAHIPRERPS